jgi:hypothetical protein
MEQRPRLSTRMITACRWTEEPFIADGAVKHYVKTSPRHTIRLSSSLIQT